MAFHALNLAFVFLCLHHFFLHPCLVVTSDHVLNINYMTVPSSVFLSAINSTIENVKVAQNLAVLMFADKSKDTGMMNAIGDCVELLNDTTDDLSMSQSVIQYLDCESCGTGNRNADLKTWLSAAISDQYTCIEGLQGVQGLDKINFINNLQSIIFQVSNILGMVSDISFGDNGNFQTRQKPSEEIPVSTFVVVAKDGSGDFISIMDAVLAAPSKSKQKYLIYIKNGTYKENVEIKKDKWNLILIGDGMDSTIISGNRSVIGSKHKLKTYATATLSVSGQRFMAHNLTIENTAGPKLGQAVALRSNSDLSVFYKCRFRGYQDTLYVHSNRQFYRECEITGTVDFIFGKGTAVFQNCTILVRKPGSSYITAHSRISSNLTTGFSIQFSNISSDFIPSSKKSAFLGRPWREYARTVFMQSYLGDIIRPEGWKPWNDTMRLDKLYYGEYRNSGPGANLDRRVKWPGYHVMNSSEAESFTVANFINGDLWLPSTSVTYAGGLEAN
ncbi:hypothetical protein AQUCO_03300002v1 [Aquilegia coerulea]|uniref:Pectinesterase n=1 Tax=Aquilegia coerulea TaxID=218851 RepID=A0A2G5CZ23_AQUCA|nr:hypothetical protein AQUCO_03300002v1 [Aquilegia coerulea]